MRAPFKTRGVASFRKTSDSRPWSTKARRRRTETCDRGRKLFFPVHRQGFYTAYRIARIIMGKARALVVVNGKACVVHAQRHENIFGQKNIKRLPDTTSMMRPSTSVDTE